MIRNIDTFNQWQPAGFDGQFHWDFLKEAFGPVIMPMDMDAVVERNGRFFIFETKSSENVSIPHGQLRSLRALVKTGFFTIMILYGKSADSITSYKLWYRDQERRVSPANAQSVYNQCAEWYEFVNSLSPPDYPDDLQFKIADLQKENSQLRSSLEQANCRIHTLTQYTDRLERAFKLEPPKQKATPNKSLYLALDNFKRPSQTMAVN